MKGGILREGEGKGRDLGRDFEGGREGFWERGGVGANFMGCSLVELAPRGGK